MLQNIYILAGEPPKDSGDTERDLRAVTQYLQKLAKGLEYSFEQLDARLEKEESGHGKASGDAVRR